jgi:hypothetical protein
MKCMIVQLILAEEIGNWSKYRNVDDCFVCRLCSDFAVGLAGPKWKMIDVTTTSSRRFCKTAKRILKKNSRPINSN